VALKFFDESTMVPSKSLILERLRAVKGPGMQGNIVDLGLVSEILVEDGRVSFAITVPQDRAGELEPVRQAAERAVRQIEGVRNVLAVLTAERRAGPIAGRPGSAEARIRERVAEARAGLGAPAQAPAPGPQRQPQHRVPGIRHMIAVASGKGGVGKSTTAVNLALGFNAVGLKSGILDADIYGPSQPRLLGLSGRPQVVANKLRPMEAYGLKTMSMGLLVDEATPVIWRGPMVVSALTQMLRDVAWGELDVLVIDMPPGTGDVQLTMAQQAPLSGAIIVSTPQDLALIDARKGLAMFRRVDVPVLGIIENMSTFICPHCGTRSDIFGHGGAEAEARRLAVPFLGSVPLDMAIRSTSDEGRPIVASSPDSAHARAFCDIARAAWSELKALESVRTEPPKLEIKGGGSELSVAFAGAEPFTLTAEMLRVMSPSAEVQGHAPEQRVTVARKRKVRIRELRPVGNYAVRIVFDDGHDTGLYAWSYLRTLDRERDKRWAEYLSALAIKGLDRG
jgi:ATP-binding protein involved in chromosome partitioning